MTLSVDSNKNGVILCQFYFVKVEDFDKFWKVHLI